MPVMSNVKPVDERPLECTRCGDSLTDGYTGCQLCDAKVAYCSDTCATADIESHRPDCGNVDLFGIDSLGVNATDEPTECPICLEVSLQVVLPVCGHIACRECMKKLKAADPRCLCALCRAPVGKITNLFQRIMIEPDIKGSNDYEAALEAKTRPAFLLGLRRAMWEGNFQAFHDLGVCYEFGYGVKRSRINAYKCYCFGRDFGSSECKMRLSMFADPFAN